MGLDGNLGWVWIGLDGSERKSGQDLDGNVDGNLDGNLDRNLDWNLDTSVQQSGLEFGRVCGQGLTLKMASSS